LTWGTVATIAARWSSWSWPAAMASAASRAGRSGGRLPFLADDIAGVGVGIKSLQLDGQRGQLTYIRLVVGVFDVQHPAVEIFRAQ